MRRAVDEWLATNASDSVIIEYPLSYTMKGQSLYYTMAHRQKIVHGYSQLLPKGYTDLLPVLNQWPGPKSIGSACGDRSLVYFSARFSGGRLRAEDTSSAAGYSS